MTTEHEVLLPMDSYSTGEERVTNSRLDGDRIDCPEEPVFLSCFDGYGYYPSAEVGHRLGVDGRYELVRKLGWARSSTVWLATDTQANVKAYVAIKILTACATRMIKEDLSEEYKVFMKIESTAPDHPGFQHCLALRDHFLISSMAGDHSCFVTDVLGSCLKTWRPPGRRTFTVPIAKRIIKQLLLALYYLHDECGYIHTDIKSDNVLVQIPKMSSPQIDDYLQVNPAATYDTYNKPLKEVPFSQSIVFTRSQPLPNIGLSTSLDNISVCLIDYGEATPVNKAKRGNDYQPPIVRAPEVILGYPWSSSVDIWTVGCLLFEIITDFHLFGQDTYSVDFHLQNMVEYLGPFPLQFLEACTRRSDYFDENGNLLRLKNFTSASIEDILNQLQVDKEDVPGAAAFICRCLTLDSALRPTARELLHDSWLKPI
ncbi:kinase-like domain-containing protein [Pisolithus marmoratus]|nr:kinase-like domain-containing protein [Pisolithus marmoratus]